MPDITEIDETSLLPEKDWRNFIENRTNKKVLCYFLSEYLKARGQFYCWNNQSLIVAGGFQGIHKDEAFRCSKNGFQALPHLAGNHEETDSRIFLHIAKSNFKSFMVYSPDTDVYHIGLPVCVNKDVVIQLNITFGNQTYIPLPKLREALDNDIELRDIYNIDRYNFIQKLFICSGCDYVSCFGSHGKSAFLKNALKFATFAISGQLENGTRVSGNFLLLPEMNCSCYTKHKLCTICQKNVMSDIDFIDCANFENVLEM